MPEIKIDAATLSFLLFLFIFEDTASVLIMICCVLIHECAHIVMAYLMGVGIKSIHINIFGARIELSSSLGSYASEAFIAFGGPAVNIAMGILGIIIAKGQVGDRLLFFTLTNFSLAFLNLLPISTLDGGRILSALLKSFFDVGITEKIMRFFTFSLIISLWLLSVFLWFRFGKNIALAMLSMYMFLTLIIKRGY